MKASTVLLFLAACAAAAGCGRRADDRTEAAAVWNEVLEAYAAAGRPIADPPPLVWVDVTQMAQRLAREAERRAEALALGADVEEVLDRLRSFALRAGRVTPAHFDPDRRELLVCSDTIERLAVRRLGDARGREQLLRGVLLHEAAHVRLDDRFGLFRRLREAAKPDRLGAADLLAEAAAQALAEQVARAAGRPEAAALGVPPADDSPEARAFVAALAEARRLLEKGGEEALAAAVEARRLGVGTEEPSPDPAAEAAFAAILEWFGEGEVRRFATPPEVIRASLAFLPSAEADRMADSIVLDRSLRWRREEEAGTRTVGCSLRRHEGTQSAGALLSALRAAFAAQADLSLHPFARDGVKGFLVERVITGGDTEVVSAFAVAGDTSLSLLFDGVALTQEDARVLVADALERAVAADSRSGEPGDSGD